MVGTHGHPAHATETEVDTPDHPALIAGVTAHVPAVHMLAEVPDHVLAVHMAVEDVYPKVQALHTLEDGMTILILPFYHMMFVCVLLAGGDIHVLTPDLCHGLALPLSGRISLLRGPQPLHQIAPLLGQWWTLKYLPLSVHVTIHTLQVL